LNIKAIIFGATGMVGEGVLQMSLNHPSVESVLVIGRKSCGKSHPKLKEIIHNNFFDYKNIEEVLKGYNACFFCLGVSSIGMKEEDYKRITYNLTMSAAKTLAALNPGMTFCYVSGSGTDSTEKGRLMWARIKGKTENDLFRLPFKDSYMFRPGFIKPLKGQKNAYKASQAIGLFYPVLKILITKYVCTMENLGLAMIHAAESGYSKKILENKDIKLLALSK